jgi:hypothetical protein
MEKEAAQRALVSSANTRAGKGQVISPVPNDPAVCCQKGSRAG